MRSSFGTITFRKNARGDAVSLKARYVNPLDPSKRVYKGFPLGAKAMAQAWLDAEEKYRDECFRDHVRWLSPAERERQKQVAVVRFRDYAGDFVEGYRTADGRRPVAASMRKKREALSHLDGFFGDMMVGDITAPVVESWLDGGYVDGVHVLRRAYQMLKAVMRKALAEGLIEQDPCTRPNPRLPRSRQPEIPAATREELEVIYRAMPDYSRISIYLGAVMGLRISEVCALQRGDIDFRHGIMRIRRALTRGEGDVGALGFKETKTDTSRADLPIPRGFVPMLKAHLERFCDPGSDALVIHAARRPIMSPNTLRGQFDKAKMAADRSDLHFHTLRATAITTSARVGGTPKDVQELARHADPEISLDLYERATDTGTRKVMDRVFDALVAPDRTRDQVSKELEKARADLERDCERVARLEAELGDISAR